MSEVNEYVLETTSVPPGHKSISVVVQAFTAADALLQYQIYMEGHGYRLENLPPIYNLTPKAVYVPPVWDAARPLIPLETL